MGDEPLGDVTHAERRELDALRTRAYGPDADILGDAPAVARLNALEDRVRNDRLAGVPGRSPVADPADPVDAEPPAPESRTLGTAVARTAPARTPARSRRPWLITGAVAAAALIGGVAWSGTLSESPAPLATGSTASAAAANEARTLAYERYIDGMRADVLSLPGSEQIANRMIHDQLRPYGTLFGRTVGAGPTTDHQFCMIIADLPASSVGCISIDDDSANPVSITLQARYFDSAIERFVGLGKLVTYTLMPGGSIVAVAAAP